MMNRVIGLISVFFLKLTSYLPFFVIYRIADLLYFVFRYIIRYRSKVIDRNLLNSFPEMTDLERTKIKRRFYRHLADITIESLKVDSISTKSMVKHMNFTNLELLNTPEYAGKSVVCVMAHYGNWEWFAILNKITSLQAAAIYRPQHNATLDEFMYKMRTRWGSKQYPMKSSFRDLIVLGQTTKWIVGVLSDQTPAGDRVQYRTQFLNQNTAVHVGAEKIAQKLKTSVVYAWVEKPKRGYYEVTLLPMFSNGEATAENEITEAITKLIEKQVIHRPDLWLWSHNRWKRNYESHS